MTCWLKSAEVVIAATLSLSAPAWAQDSDPAKDKTDLSQDRKDLPQGQGGSQGGP